MSAVEALSPQEACARLTEFCVVDVRARHEFDGPLGRIPGARIVPLDTLEREAARLPGDRPLLMVCRSGRRSEMACGILAAHGRRALNLTGGMIAWNRAGLPVERWAPASLAELRDAIVAWFSMLSGRDAAAARSAVEAALADAAAAWDAPGVAGLGCALDALEAELRRAGPPPDLDLSVDAFRRWLAEL